MWSHTMFSYVFWARYRCALDALWLIARVVDVAAPPDGAKPVEGDGVIVRPVPYYRGPVGYALRWASVRRAVAEAVEPGDAVILRVPSFVADPLWYALRRRRQPYAVEVVGDPWEVFGAGGVGGPLRPVLRQYFTRQLRAQCASAVAASYVTSEYLQRRYPCPGYTAAISTVELAPDAPPTRIGARDDRPPRRLLFVGSLEQPYKGADVLLRALARLEDSVRLTVVGDGACRPALERLAADLGVAARVSFVGKVPAGEAVRARMDDADLFVLPSRTEGLPRVLIEAMARGLPCIATPVGGIPELLSSDDLVPVGDDVALAARIRQVLDDPGRLESTSRRNVVKAGEFAAPVLQARRDAFYAEVKAATLKVRVDETAGARLPASRST